MALTVTPAELTATALTLTTAAQPNITSVGTLTTLTVDDITINSSTISDAGDLGITSGGLLTIDVAGDIILDADGGDILFKDGGTHWASLYTNGTHTYLQNMVNSGDIYLSGKDASGNGVNALILDMSNGGMAHFNNGITLQDMGINLNYTSYDNRQFGVDSNGLFLYNAADSRYDLLIDDDGNVGIGTNNPSKKLHVNMGGTLVTGQTYDAMIIQNSDAVQLRIVDAGDGGGNGGHGGIGNDNGNINIASAGVMTFSTALTANEALYGGGAGTGGDERMRITSAGNVGIGTSSPTAPLDVVSNSSAVGIDLRGRSSDNIGQLSFESNDSGTTYSQIQSRSTELYVKTIANIPMSFHTNNTERMRIDGGGTVLAGGVTNTAGGYMLKVGHSNNQGEFGIYADSNGADLLSYDRTNGAYNPIKIHAGAVSFTRGNQTVSIGTQVPDFRVNQMLGVTSAGARGGVSISSYHNSAAGPIFDFNISRNVSPGSHTVVQTNDALGTFIFRGDDGDEFVDSAAIECNVDDAPGNGDMPGRLVFYTSPDGTTGLQERMRINNDGYVGIGPGGGGAGSPSALLGVVGSNSNTAADAAVYVSSGGTADWSQRIYEPNDYGLVINAGSSMSYAFYINDASSNTQRFRINGVGDVWRNGATQITSDERKKKNIVDMPSQWDEFKQIRWRNFEWKDEVIKGTQFGVIAQEVQAINPDLITVDPLTKEQIEEGIEDPKMLSVTFEMLHTKGMKALQEAMERIETLEAEVKALKGE